MIVSVLGKDIARSPSHTKSDWSISCDFNRRVFKYTSETAKNKLYSALLCTYTLVLRMEWRVSMSTFSASCTAQPQPSLSTDI